MRASVVVSTLLAVVGAVIALVAMETPCYAQTIPGIPPSGYSCAETQIIAAGGIFLFALGLIVAVSRGRSRQYRAVPSTAESGRAGPADEGRTRLL